MNEQELSEIEARAEIARLVSSGTPRLAVLDVPALVAEVRRLREALQGLINAVEGVNLSEIPHNPMCDAFHNWREKCDCGAEIRIEQEREEKIDAAVVIARACIGGER